MALSQAQYDAALAAWRTATDTIGDQVLSTLADADLDLDAREHRQVLREVLNLCESINSQVGRLRFKKVPPPV